MAEIKIRKKKPVWPWILLVIILAILAFLYFYGSMAENDDNEIDETDDITLIFERSNENTNLLS
ncbi:hypothetical protein [Christiangramia sp. OXR-203]|jgi:uncharacterized protein YpmB|uniref:hypothetical protein n=1 Tax=Christiangramia sp. OXR-203 TaxID=3100176 RepID=UPI002AC8D3A1|nr:hypothetical protein [Christiangramia sp. OXR-203]WPY97533.1 hypothetical protein T8I65_10130 [Christiangramia sp. OXR-203]